MDSFSNQLLAVWLLASSLVLFVDGFALGAVGAAKVASDRDSDGDAYGQPDCDVAGGDAHRGADAGAESDAKADLHDGFFMFFSSTAVPRDGGSE